MELIEINEAFVGDSMPQEDALDMDASTHTWAIGHN